MAPRATWKSYLKLSHLMDALRRSVQAERGGTSSARRTGRPKANEHKRPAQRTRMKRAS